MSSLEELLRGIHARCEELSTYTMAISTAGVQQSQEAEAVSRLVAGLSTAVKETLEQAVLGSAASQTLKCRAESLQSMVARVGAMTSTREEA